MHNRQPPYPGAKSWIQPEELAYPEGSLRQSRRKGFVRFPDGKFRTVTLGVADTFFTIPAFASHSFNGHRYGYVRVSNADNELEFVPRGSSIVCGG